MSGPLASWVQAHSKLKPTPRAVVVTLALRADHFGNGADHSHDQLAELTGCHRATVVRALTDAIDAAELEQTTRGGGRGHIARYRIPIAFCDPRTGCFACTTLAKAQHGGKGRTARPNSRPKGSRSATQRVAERDTLRNRSGQLTQQQLAARAAEANLAAPERSPNGQRPGDGPPSPDPSRVVSSAADLSSPQEEDDHQTTLGLPGEPRDQGKASTGPGPRPVPGRSPNGSAHGGAARPQSREPLGASTGDPFSNPRADQSDDDTFWTQGEAALWDAGQAMEAELFELAGYCDPGRFAR